MRIPRNLRASRLRAAALLACAAVASVPALSQAEPKRLVLDPAANKTYRYQLDTEQEANVQGNVITTSMVAQASMTRVADPKSKNVLTDIVFTKVEGSMKQGDQLEQLAIGLDGQKVRAEITPQGKVVRVDAAAAASPEQKRILENLVEAFFVELPEKPVSVGDTWKVPLGNNAQGREGEGAFTLEKIEKKQGVECAHLAGDVRMESKEPPLKGKGKVESDVATTGGYLVAAKGSVTVETQGPTAVQSFELKLLP